MSTDHKITRYKARGVWFLLSWKVHTGGTTRTYTRKADYSAAKRFAKKWGIEDQLRTLEYRSEATEWD
jgi:hypothetical protein